MNIDATYRIERERWIYTTKGALIKHVSTEPCITFKRLIIV